MEQYTDIFYQEYLTEIGGVETFLYELAKKYSDRDLTIIYSGGDIKQIERLKKYVRCIKYTGGTIKCNKAFFNYSVKIIDNIQADEYIQIVHADFLDKSLYPMYKPMISDKVNKYYAVSKNNAKSFKALTGIDIDIVYNPITIEKEPRLLRLIAPQRLTGEKGGKRLEYLVQEMDKASIFYQIEIFSNQRLNIDSPNIIYRRPTLDIRRHIANSDYLVLLSDTEGYCYGIYEALCLGVPVICTRLPILDELKVNDNNAIIVDFDMSNLDVRKIYDKAGKIKFKYTQNKDIWGDLLSKSTSTYKEELNMKYKVRALNTYQQKNIVDKQLGYVPKLNEEFIVTKDRLDILRGQNAHNTVFVEVIEEIKDDKIGKEEKKTAVKRTRKTTKK